MGTLLVCIFLIVLAGVLINIWQYKQQTYFKITKTPYFTLRNDKGKIGEYQIYRKLRSYEKYGGRFLFNCYLLKSNGKTTELDVVLLCPSGIFVFESKNYSGWIFGSEDENMWTQTLPKGNGGVHKESFFNPIIQNKVHVENMKRIVGRNVPVYSIVVFSDRCTLKKMKIRSEDVHVIQLRDLVRTMRKIRGRTPNALKAEDIKVLYNKLYPSSQVSDKVKAQHILDIESSSKNTADDRNIVKSAMKTNTMVCPHCGSALVLRTAKKGKNVGKQFYGCTAYPKCQYVRDIVDVDE